MSDHERERNSIPELDRLRSDLATAFAASESDANGAASRRSRHRRVGAVLAAATAICVTSAVVISNGDDDGDSLSPLTTKQALAQVAEASLALPQPAPGQFVYSRTRYRFGSGGGGGRDLRGRRLGDYRSLVDAESESWTNPKLCGLWRHRTLTQRFPTERDRHNAERFDELNRYYNEKAARQRKARGQKPLDSPSDWERPGGETVMKLSPTGGPTVRIGNEKLTARELRRYPTDPRAIYRRVHRATRGRPSGFAGDGARGEFMTITEVLSSTSAVLPPAVRAGLINALAYVPGVRSLGREIDPEGRDGIGFELVTAGVRNHTVFEADSGVSVFREQQIVSRRGLKHADGWPVGTVVRHELVLERAIADKLPQDLKTDVGLSGFVRCPK